MSGVRISGGSPKNPVRPRGGADFFRRPQRFEVYACRGKSPAGHHVVTDCTGSRRLFLFKKPSLTCSVAPPFQNANISLVCILVFLPMLENSRTPCLFVHFTKGSVSVFDIQKDLRRPLHALCAAQPRPPPLLGLLPLCRNECLTATANTPDSTDLEKNV